MCFVIVLCCAVIEGKSQGVGVTYVSVDLEVSKWVLQSSYRGQASFCFFLL